MDIKTLIQTLSQLEKEGILSPSEYIKQNSKEKVKENVELYLQGSSYGFSDLELKDIFRPEKAPSKNIQNNQLEISYNSPSSKIFAVILGYMDWLGIEDLYLSGEDCCRIFNYTPTVGVVRKLHKLLKEKKKENKNVKDPSAYKHHYVTRFFVTSKNDFDEDLLFEIRSIVKKHCTPSFSKRTIRVEDFLDGTDIDSVIWNGQDKLNLVIEKKILNAFLDYISPHFSDSFFTESEVSIFLLNRAMENMFSKIRIEQLVEKTIPDLNKVQQDDLVKVVRRFLQEDLKTSNDIFDQSKIKISTNIIGRVYLLVRMVILYKAEELGYYSPI
jgi:hypothetical protein